jgi:hypothetical protein
MNQLGDLDPSLIIWRYLPFSRFRSFIELSALWFSKLQNFMDQEEGLTPHHTRAELKRQHREMEDWFPDEDRKRQVRAFVESNENDGRELIVANCWFIAGGESQKMWDEFGKDADAVVIKSTAGALAQSLYRSHRHWWIGKVQYIDPATYAGMDAYEGSQAHLRAYLKNAIYAHENELRVAAMNWVAPGCLNLDGSPQNEKQRAGLVYTLDRPGLYVTVNLQTLISEIHTAPGASDSQQELIEAMVRAAGCGAPVVASGLTPAKQAP